MNSLSMIMKVLTVVIIPIGGMLFYSQYATSQDVSQSVLGATAAMLSMIPEGLMLLTSVAFAVGAANLAKRKTLVQSLPCIETLARVDTICLDKTGTITDGSLSFEKLVKHNAIASEEMQRNIGELMGAVNDDNATAVAVKLKFPASNQWQVERVIPFSSARKWSGASFSGKGTFIMGAPEFIFKQIPDDYQKDILKYSRLGYRVLGVAHSKQGIENNELPKGLGLICLLILSDNIRETAVNTFQYFEKEDVTLKVISGDNPITVSNIASKAGIKNADQYVDMSKYGEEEDFSSLVEDKTVFGRVSPHQKRELVKALKANKHTTCMTGDGVNDVLSLREADVSVAMASGSDAARAAADVVLLSSDFSSMIQVLREGRRVINNIERVGSMYLVKTIYSALLAVIYILLARTYPFAPLQLAPINSLTVGIPSFFLALKPSYQRITGRFLDNVLLISVPAALTVVFNILIIELAGAWFDISHAQTSTMCVLLTGIVGFLVLIQVSKPLTVWLKIMITILMLSFVGCFFLEVDFLVFHGNMFTLDTLLTKNVFFYLPLAICSANIFNGLSYLMKKIMKGLQHFKVYWKNKRQKRQLL